MLLRLDFFFLVSKLYLFLQAHQHRPNKIHVFLCSFPNDFCWLDNSVRKKQQDFVFSWAVFFLINFRPADLNEILSCFLSFVLLSFLFDSYHSWLHFFLSCVGCILPWFFTSQKYFGKWQWERKDYNLQLSPVPQNVTTRCILCSPWSSYDRYPRQYFHCSQIFRFAPVSPFWLNIERSPCLHCLLCPLVGDILSVNVVNLPRLSSKLQHKR